MLAPLNALRFTKTIEGKFKDLSLPKTPEKKQGLVEKVQVVAVESLVHFNNCQAEKSALAGSEAYRELIRSMNIIAKRLDDSKEVE